MSYGPCTKHECNTPAVSNLYLCTKHGGQGPCSVEGCRTYATNRANGLCYKHGGGSKRGQCTVPGCNTLSQAFGLCKAHSPRKFCETPGCTNVQYAKGICKACARLKGATDALTDLHKQKELEDLEQALRGAEVLAKASAQGGFFSDMTLS